MIFNIKGFDKLPSINRTRVSIFFGSFVFVVFSIYAISQLIYARFNLTLIFTNIVLNDLLILISIIVCLSIIFYNLFSLPKSLNLQVTNYGINVGQWKYTYQSIKAFSIIDLGDYFEIILKTSDLRTPFVYFYVDENNTQLPDLISVMSDLVPYQEDLEEIDKFHIFLRTLGLK